MNTVNQVGIYNMALGQCGVSRFINSVTDQTSEARTCNIFWENVRDQVLARIDWLFARRSAILELTTLTSNAWKYVYAYPSDCLAAREVVSGQDFFLKRYQHDAPFEVAENECGGGLVVLANERDAMLTYTARITTYTLWSPAFVNCLSLLLGSKIAGPLSSNPKYANQLGSAYEVALQDAAASSLNEQHARPDAESELILTRG
jgi:hypothetical protein